MRKILILSAAGALLAAAAAAEMPRETIIIEMPDGKVRSITGTREDLWSQAERLIDAGDFELARQYYTKIIDKDPADVRTHILLGQLYQFHFGRLADAVRFYKTAERLVPASNPEGKAFCQRRAAEVYRDLAEKTNSIIYFAQAITEYEKILSVKPDDPEVLYFLGTCRLNSRDYERAAAVFRRVVEIDKKGQWGAAASKALAVAQREAAKKR